MSVTKLIRQWNADPSVSYNFCAKHEIEATDGVFVPFPTQIHPKLVKILRGHGIDNLYSHQAKAWYLLHEGGNITIITGTSSGKSLCYNLPVLDQIIKHKNSTALYIFPTKALSHDQAKSLNNLADLLVEDISSPAHAALSISKHLQILTGIYDGDTPKSKRKAIRNTADIVFTNPDMLHLGILPQHSLWHQFFSNLKFIVIDEIHIYRGVFGSHVANVIRRLKRIANFYHSKPQFILTSATIANPIGFSEKLIEEKVTLINQDGSPHSKKSFYLYNPPIIDQGLGLRRSATSESIRLAEDLLTYDVQSIIFARSRRAVELILSYLRDVISSNESTTPHAIRGYRSGYLPKLRREIEKGIKEGTVKIVVSTNALELGIDIGGMGAVIIVGFPGTIAATMQQAGRAGRQKDEALAILVLTSNPLDQFLSKHPEYLFDRSPEHVLINPDNLLILLSHIKCATFEIPFKAGENFGNLSTTTLQEYLDFLSDEARCVHKSGANYYWMSSSYPSQSVSLRSTGTNNILLQEVQEQSDNNISKVHTIGVIEKNSALWMTHPNAIYLHEGKSFLVDNLDLKTNIASLIPVTVDYFTQSIKETNIILREIITQRTVTNGTINYGEINVTSQVVGYKKIKWQTHEILDTTEIEMPPTQLMTVAYWLTIDQSVAERLREQGLWLNDTNKYGANWSTQKYRARLRDNFICQVCGKVEEDKAHDVHHIKPFKMFSSFKTANRLDNLITLCSSCHKQAEINVRIRSGLAGLAYVFEHLAPLFLMCDLKDIGVHFDTKSPITDGSPTIFIYDQIPAGLGFSKYIYEIHDELVKRSYESVTSCECQNGCPSCIGPGGIQELGGKRETIAILSELLSIS